MFKFLKKDPPTPSDKIIEEIKKILFPPLKLQTASKDGQITKFHIDYSVDSNLDAVLMDLQEGYNDEVSQKTINKVINRLNKVRTLLEAYAELDKDAQYIIVENLEDSEDVEAASENFR